MNSRRDAGSRTVLPDHNALERGKVGRGGERFDEREVPRHARILLRRPARAQARAGAASAREIASTSASPGLPAYSITRVGLGRRRAALDRCNQQMPRGAEAGAPCLRFLAPRRAWPLTLRPAPPIHCPVSRLDGRSGKRRKVAGEESPGSMDIRCRITSGGGDPRESATENRPPRALPRAAAAAARVKRCGKSAPRLPATQTAWQTPPGARPNRDGAERIRREADAPDRCPDPAVRVGCSRRRATGVPEEWPSRVRLALTPHRTRLTGRLI